MKRDKDGILRFENTDGLQLGNKVKSARTGLMEIIDSISGGYAEQIGYIHCKDPRDNRIGGYFAKELSPISLTPELVIETLTNAGFNVSVDSDGNIHFKKHLIKYHFIVFDNYDEYYDEKCFLFSYHGLHLSFFHELQNFIKLLTRDLI